MGSVTFDHTATALSAEASLQSRVRSVNSVNSRETIREDRMSISLEVQQIQMFMERMNGIDGMGRSQKLLLRKAQLNVEIDFQRMERYVDNAEKLEALSPDLLKEYLAVIKLLDKNTPDRLDPFFDELENTLESIARDGETAYERVSSLFVSVRIDVFSFSLSSGEEIQKGDPLLFDLDDDGLELTNVDGGIDFDLDADGRIDRMASVGGGDAFLAMDRNGNNRIDDGRELFGDQRGAQDGFAELARLDENRDRRIDAADSSYSYLSLFDGHGLRSLTSAGISAINLAVQQVFHQINGNDIIGTATFERTDGSQGTVAEALLAYR